MPVSAVDCVQPALQHRREQLFTRFRFGQWSRLALVGILAAELHVGGCNFGNFGGGWPRAPHKNDDEFLPSGLPNVLSPFGRANIPAHMSEHIAQFIGLILVGIFAFIILAFVFLYIHDVFRFILFDSVLSRQCSIGDGWRKWRRAGGRFFLWQIVFLVSTWLSLAFFVGLPLALAFAAGWTTNLRQHIVRLIVGVVLLFGLFATFVLAVAVIQALAKDFLVPIMAIEGLDFADGWRRLLAMIGLEKGRFAIYLLLKLVLAIAAGLLFTIVASVPALLCFVPTRLAAVGGRAAGMGCDVTYISLAFIFL